MAKKCPFCGKGSLKEDVDLAIHNGKTEAVNVLRCTSCGKSLTHISDYEEMRKSLKPTLLERFCRFFKSDSKIVELNKGKLL